MSDRGKDDETHELERLQWENRALRTDYKLLIEALEEAHAVAEGRLRDAIGMADNDYVAYDHISGITRRVLERIATKTVEKEEHHGKDNR